MKYASRVTNALLHINANACIVMEILKPAQIMHLYATLHAHKWRICRIFYFNCAHVAHLANMLYAVFSFRDSDRCHCNTNPAWRKSEESISWSRCTTGPLEIMRYFLEHRQHERILLLSNIFHMYSRWFFCLSCLLHILSLCYWISW